jgi:heme-degrading monooxygenase HmoA
MVYVNLRLNVANFDTWLAAFHSYESYRQSLGSTGVNQIYHDVDDPNTVTVIMEWDEAANAQAFLNNPQTKVNMDKAGITRRSVLAVQTKV